MDGFENLENQTFGTLRVQGIAGRNPLRYSVVCMKCATQSVETHRRLRNGGSCKNAGCGKDAIRETSEDSLAKFHRRREAVESSKAFAESERTRKLERDVAQVHGKVRAAIRERILSGKDDEVYITPELRTKVMTQAQADAYNKQQADGFVRSTPEWNERFANRENLNILGDYFNRNSLAIIDSSMIRAAFERLRDCGALREIEPVSPAQEPESPTAEPESETPQERTDGTEGWDPATGESRFYTWREVDQMSAEAYRKAFKLTREKLTVARRLW